MKLPFFSKDDNADAPHEPETGTQNDQQIIKVEGSDIVLEADTGIDITEYEHVAIPLPDSDGEQGGALFADALIPFASNAANAAAQYNQAIVRFPDGAGWGDLIGRKTPGWEEWKQLGILKDGKFQPQAAIRQAKLQPMAVANLALQGAAIVVGQAYMAEISKQLEGIQSEISAIQEEMKIEREASIEASFKQLREYLTFYGEIEANPERRSAVHGEIEGIKRDALAAWLFQVRSMESMQQKLSSARRMKNEKLAQNINAFRAREREAQAAFRLLIAAEQASMQYDHDFSSKRIDHEIATLTGYLESYTAARDDVQSNLVERIERMRGSLLEIPEAQEDGYTAKNPVLDVAHAVRKNAPRIWIPAMREEAVERLEAKRDRWESVARAQSPLDEIKDSRVKALNEANFIYNVADAVLIDENGVQFLCIAEDPEDDEEPQQPEEG